MVVLVRELRKGRIMKSIVPNVKKIAVKVIDFTTKFAPITTVVAGVAATQLGLVVAPVALSVIGGVTLACSILDAIRTPTVNKIAAMTLEAGVARFAGYAVLGKVTIWLVSIQLMFMATVIVSAVIIAAVAAACLGCKDMSAKSFFDNVAVPS